MSAEARDLAPSRNKGLIRTFAERFGVEADKLLPALKQTAFRVKSSGGAPVEVTDAQMMALIIVANQYGLNPWTKELYAFPQDGGIVPIVGIDGWARIINDHPNFNGMEFEDVGEINERGSSKKPCPEGIKCRIFRKDRDHPIEVTEWYEECYRPTQPWNGMPRRQLRHKAMIQCARVAFSFAGIYDADEANDIIEGQVVIVEESESGRAAQTVNDLLDPSGTGAPVAERVEDDGSEPTTGDTAPAAGDDDAATADAPRQYTTVELLELIKGAETVDDLDFIRTANDDREAKPQDKATVTKSLNAKAEKLGGGASE